MSAAQPTPLQRMELHGARVLDALPPRAKLLLAGNRPLQVDGDQLDPGVQLLLRLLDRLGIARLRGPDADPVGARAHVRSSAIAFAGPLTAVEAVRDLDVEGAVGPLPARHYTPLGGSDSLLVFFHGGGFVTGDLDTHDEPCRVLCRHAGVHVLSVEYRLAPEHPFPAPVEDAVAALRWAIANAASLGADPGAVAVGGDSAGGNLAAVATQALVREGGPAPVLQVLIYPVTDFAARTRSQDLFGDGLFLTDADQEWFTDHYLQGRDPADPRLSPLRAADLGGLPPAIVVTAGFDPLRDEGEAYAAALSAAGVRVAHWRARGLIHGFINFGGVNRPSREGTMLLAGMVRAELAPARAGEPAAAG
jgi:acetyl esterase